jgi:hypothetical protein
MILTPRRRLGIPDHIRSSDMVVVPDLGPTHAAAYHSERTSSAEHRETAIRRMTESGSGLARRGGAGMRPESGHGTNPQSSAEVARFAVLSPVYPNVIDWGTVGRGSILFLESWSRRD